MHIDARTGEVVLRIVYEGSSGAGKTASLEQLARLVPSTRIGVACVGAQAREVDRWFDWLDFSGGWVEGRKIRLQLMTSPQSTALARGRRALLTHADAVVFVADSRRRFQDAARRSAESAVAILREVRPTGVGLIVQANHRDARDALDLEELAGTTLRALGEAPVLATTASAGTGVMEALVRAGHLATDTLTSDLVDELIARPKSIGDVASLLTLLGPEVSELAASMATPPPADVESGELEAGWSLPPGGAEAPAAPLPAAPREEDLPASPPEEPAVAAAAPPASPLPEEPAVAAPAPPSHPPEAPALVAAAATPVPPSRKAPPSKTPLSPPSPPAARKASAPVSAPPANGSPAPPKSSPKPKVAPPSVPKPTSSTPRQAPPRFDKLLLAPDATRRAPAGADSNAKPPVVGAQLHAVTMDPPAARPPGSETRETPIPVERPTVPAPAAQESSRAPAEGPSAPAVAAAPAGPSAPAAAAKAEPPPPEPSATAAPKAASSAAVASAALVPAKPTGFAGFIAWLTSFFRGLFR